MIKSGPPGLRRDFDEEFTAARLAMLLGLLMFISYPDIILGTHAFFFRDAGQFGYPVAYYLRNCFWRHEIPLWNPYSDCGVPFLAQWLTLALYPPSLFYILLPLPWSMNFFILGHVFLAGMGMYFLAWRWFGSRFAASVAGLAFAWNGMALHCWMWPNLIATLGWMPWVILLCERAREGGRRRFVLAALAGAFQMMTGSPEEIIYTWLIVLGCLLVSVWQEKARFWEGARRLSGIAVLVACLSAAQLLPWMDLLAHGDRTTAAGGNDWSMPVWGAANFLVPLFRMGGSVSGVFMQLDQQWASSYYMGILPLLLALLAILRVRKARILFLGILAIGGVLCAMGDAGVVLKLMRSLLPFLGITRFPIKYVIFTVFCLPLLAAAGVVWLQANAGEVTRSSLIWLGGLLWMGVLALAFFIPFTEDSRSVVGINGLVRLGILAAGIGAIFYQPRCPQKSRQLLVSFAFLFVMGLDISTHVPRQNPTIPVGDYGRLEPAMTRVPRLGESRAMIGSDLQNQMMRLFYADAEQMHLAQRLELYSDYNLLDEVPKVNGFFPIHLREENAVIDPLYHGERAPQLEQFLGVSQVSRRLFDFNWEPQTNYMRWASIGQQPVFLNEAATLEELKSSHFAPREVVMLSPEWSGEVTAQADPEAAILSSDFTPERCAIRTQSTNRTMLVVAQAYYHCWKATVDDQAVRLYQANEGFQAVEVPAGIHQVVLVYKDLAFQIGGEISLVTLLFCVITIIPLPHKADRLAKKTQGLGPAFNS